MLSCSSRGMESLHSTGRPLTVCLVGPFRHTLSADAISMNVTKPNPRPLPVNLSAGPGAPVRPWYVRVWRCHCSMAFWRPEGLLLLSLLLPQWRCYSPLMMITSLTGPNASKNACGYVARTISPRRQLHEGGGTTRTKPPHHISPGMPKVYRCPQAYLQVVLREVRYASDKDFPARIAHVRAKPHDPPCIRITLSGAGGRGRAGGCRGGGRANIGFSLRHPPALIILPSTISASSTLLRVVSSTMLWVVAHRFAVQPTEDSRPLLMISRHDRHR